MAKKKKVKAKPRFVTNGKPATKPHKNSFLKDAEIEKLMKKMGAEGYLVLAYKAGVGVETTVHIKRDVEHIANTLRSLERVKHSLLVESLPLLGQTLSDILTDEK